MTTLSNTSLAKTDFKSFIGIWNKEQNQSTPTIHEKMADWLQRSWEGSKTRLLLMAFRSSGKSTLVGLFSAWLLYLKPELRILVLAADFSLAKKMVRNVKRIIELHPLTTGMKPSKADQWASDRWTVNRELELRDPSMLARGLSSNITGSRADIVICDDVEVPGTSDTAEKRADLREKLLEIAYVLVPGGTQLYVGTPHTFFTIYETEPRTDYGEERAFLQRFRALKIPVYDEERNSAWPEKFSALDIRNIEEQTGPNKFASQMMLEPVNITEGRLDPDLLNIYEEDLDYAKELKTLFLGKQKLVAASAWWDPAFGSAKGDDSVLAVVFTDNDGNYYLHRMEYIDISRHPDRKAEGLQWKDPHPFAGGSLDVARDDASGLDEATAQCRVISRIAKELHLPSITVETNGIGRFLPSILKNELVRAAAPAAVQEFANTRPKDLRILEAFDAVLAARRLYVHRSVTRTPFMREIREWTPGRKSGRDDGLDAVAGALSQTPVRLKRLYRKGSQNWTRGKNGFQANTNFKI